MQTRRTKSLKNVDIGDLIKDDLDKSRKSSQQSKKIAVSQQSQQSQSQQSQQQHSQYINDLVKVVKQQNNLISKLINERKQSIIQPVPPKIIDQRVAINQERNQEPVQVPAQEPAQVPAQIIEVQPVVDSASLIVRAPEIELPKQQNVYLVLDTESFQIETELGQHTIVPLQVAWGVYRWSGHTLELLNKSNCYMSEVMCIGRFRDAIRGKSERTYLKHEAKMKTSGYHLVTTKELLAGLHQVITEHKVNTITAYNISWDFEAIRNMIRIFGVEHPSFDGRCDNPFNPLRIAHVDLMHEVVKKYGEQLIKQGILDGTVRKESERVWLRKNSRYSKTVFSAEYVLEHFFKVIQQHTADDDVNHESLILLRILQEFGESSLEYGVMYPQRSGYHAMLKMANDALASSTQLIRTPVVTRANSFADEDIVEALQLSTTGIPKDNLPGEAIRILSNLTLERQPTPHPSCLF